MANKETMYEKTTGALYGSLFTAYDEQKFDESAALFETRHKHWGIDLEWFKSKSCLDAGCGGGRYLVALARLGASQVTGIDISQPAVDAANARLRSRGLSNVALARLGSVLELPVANASFDYVVSSGVIHHTPNPKKGFDELTRVLKPGGKLFLSVYGRGGLFWMVNDIGRLIARIVPFAWMEAFWKALGVPANKRYNYMDNLYVPYCARFTQREILKWLADAGYENVRRLKFERYDYAKLWSRFMYGEGWLQFYADKKSYVHVPRSEMKYIPQDEMKAHFNEIKYEWKTHTSWFLRDGILEELVAPLAKDSLIVDLGCGSGETERRLAAAGYTNLVGVDICNFFQAGNFGYLREFHEKNLSLDELPIASDSADVVLCIQTLEHLENPWHCAREMLRVAKPGALIVVGLPNSLSLINRLKFLFTGDVDNYSVNNWHVAWFSKSLFLKLWSGKVIIKRKCCSIGYIKLFNRKIVFSGKTLLGKLLSRKIAYVLVKL
ncbi:MAG: class I SAM-dependent methyltransferase [Patescibacteria group bacterium]